MVTYTHEEDLFLVKTHGIYLKNGGRPKWTEIQDIFNDEIADKTGKFYTVSMLRNRLQRMRKGQKMLMQSKKRRRNRCGKCGQYMIGHSCTIENTTDDTNDNIQLGKTNEAQKDDTIVISDEDICSTIETYENMHDINSFTLPPYLSIASEARHVVSSPTFGFLY